MKKIFTFMFVLLVMSFATNAQIVLSESFDTGTLPTGWTAIDSDGDSYTWDAAMPVSGQFYCHSGVGCIASASYINNFGALTPDNWLITPAITLTNNSTLTFWLRGQDATYFAENMGVFISTTGATVADFPATPALQVTSTNDYVQQSIDLSAYTGQTIYIAFRHYNITDMYWLNLDDVEIFSQPTTPTIAATPTTLTFPITAIGNTADLSATVQGYVITGNITATATAPYTVSTDNITYAATANLAANGGTLYVRYTPTTATTETGTITLTATGATDVTINVTGQGVDCSSSISTLPWTEDFEGDVFPPLCWELNSTSDTTWTVYDYNGNWMSCLGANLPQNEALITKTFDLSNYNNTILLDFDFLASYTYTVTNGANNLEIFASTDGGLTYATTPLWSLNQIGEFNNYTSTHATANLSSLAGEDNVKLKFVYSSIAIASSQILFDNLNLYFYDAPTLIANNEEFSFYGEIGTTQDNNTTIDVFNLSDDAVATTTAPFAVSADGTSFGPTANLGLNGGTLYIRYTATLGTQNGTITISSTGATDITIALNGEGYDCSGNNFPIDEDFNTPVCPVGCWNIVYANNDPTINPMTHTDIEGNGNYAFTFSSYSQADNYNQYLITPEMTFNGEMAVIFDYASTNTLFGASEEQFKLGWSSTTNDVNAFTWTNTLTARNAAFTPFFLQIPAGTKYIALNYFSDYQYYLYIDNFQVVEYTGIDETVSNDNTMVYPNPSNDVINISTIAKINNITLFNMAGQQLISFDANDVTAQINVTDFANGLYFLKINTENGSITKKITIAR